MLGTRQRGNPATPFSANRGDSIGANHLISIRSRIPAGSAASRKGLYSPWAWFELEKTGGRAGGQKIAHGRRRGLRPQASEPPPPVRSNFGKRIHLTERIGSVGRFFLGSNRTTLRWRDRDLVKKRVRRQSSKRPAPIAMLQGRRKIRQLQRKRAAGGSRTVSECIRENALQAR